MIGKTLLKLNLRARYGVSVIALRRCYNNCDPIISPAADDVIEEDDIIVAIGHNKNLAKLNAF